jgi:hypothetical protein
MDENDITQEIWADRLFMRVGRLIRFARLEAPEDVMAKEKELIMKAVLHLEPKPLADALANLAQGIIESERKRGLPELPSAPRPKRH